MSNTNLSSLLYLQAGTVNPATFSKAFNEWRYFNFEIQRYKGLDGFVCPCCQDHQHSVHVDGNKKLYRYAKVPRYRNCAFCVLYLQYINIKVILLALIGVHGLSISEARSSTAMMLLNLI